MKETILGGCSLDMGGDPSWFLNDGCSVSRDDGEIQLLSSSGNVGSCWYVVWGEKEGWTKFTMICVVVLSSSQFCGPWVSSAMTQLKLFREGKQGCYWHVLSHSLLPLDQLHFDMNPSPTSSLGDQSLVSQVCVSIYNSKFISALQC